MVGGLELRIITLQIHSHIATNNLVSLTAHIFEQAT